LTVPPSDRHTRIAAALIVAAGIVALGVAILADELGLPAEQARGFGWEQITLLAVGGAVAAIGALLFARPQIASSPEEMERIRGYLREISKLMFPRPVARSESGQLAAAFEEDVDSAKTQPELAETPAPTPQRAVSGAGRPVDRPLAEDEVRKEQDRFLQRHGYPLNLVTPRSYNEKICWRKLFDRNPLFPIIADKYRVREFIEVMLGPEDAERYLVPLLFETPDPAAIPFDQLPSEYAIKMNHGYAMNFIIREGCEVPNEEIIKRCRKWINIDWSLRHNEWAYSEIDRRIIGEELFADEEGRPPRDFKLHMFDGKCRLIQVMASDEWYDGHTVTGQGVTRTFYTPDWNEVKLMSGLESAPEEKPPDELEEITDLARRLSSPFDYMRVDFYLAGGDVRFGEFTMYPAAGRNRFVTAELDFEMGRAWRLPARRAPLDLSE
jgi:hypothetical protein